MVFLTFLLNTILAGVVGYCFNWAHWRQSSRAERRESFADNLIGQVEAIESDSLDYWLGSRAHDEKGAFDSLEIKLNASLRFLERSLALFIKVIGGRRIRESRGLYEESFFNLYEEITSGPFESTERKALKNKALLISMKCSDLKALIVETSSG